MPRDHASILDPHVGHELRYYQTIDQVNKARLVGSTTVVFDGIDTMHIVSSAISCVTCGDEILLEAEGGLIAPELVNHTIGGRVDP